jgi:FMN reductase
MGKGVTPNRPSGKEKADLKVIGVSAGSFPTSSSTLLMKEVLKKIQSLGGKTESIFLSQWNLPFFQPDLDLTNYPQVTKLKKKSVEGDAFVIATPEYHGAVPGRLKNFFDFHQEEFSGKLFALLVSTSRGLGHPVISELISIIHHLHGWILPYPVAVSPHDLDGKGKWKKEIQERIHNLSSYLFSYGVLLKKGKKSCLRHYL